MEEYTITRISVPSPTLVTRHLRTWFAKKKMSLANQEGWNMGQIQTMVAQGEAQALKARASSKRTTPVRLRIYGPAPRTGEIVIAFIRGTAVDILEDRTKEVGRVVFERISQ